MMPQKLPESDKGYLLPLGNAAERLRRLNSGVPDARVQSTEKGLFPRLQSDLTGHDAASTLARMALAARQQPVQAKPFDPLDVESPDFSQHVRETAMLLGGISGGSFLRAPVAIQSWYLFAAANQAQQKLPTLEWEDFGRYLQADASANQFLVQQLGLKVRLIGSSSSALPVFASINEEMQRPVTLRARRIFRVMETLNSLLRGR